MKTCLLLILFVIANFTVAQSTIPNYPEILTKKDLLKQRKPTHLKTDEDTLEYLVDMKNLYKRIDRDKFDLNSLAPRERSTFEGLTEFFAEARRENSEVTKLKIHVNKFKKDAEKLKKAWKKRTKRITHSDSVKHLEKMITAAEDFSEELRGALATLTEQIENEKKDVQRRIDIVVANAKNFIASTLARADTFIDAVENEDTEELQKSTFNSGIRKAARDISQNIINIIKYKNSMGGVFEDIDDLEEIAVDITEWANNGRKIGEGGGEETVAEELVIFKRVIQQIKTWHNKQP